MATVSRRTFFLGAAAAVAAIAAPKVVNATALIGETARGILDPRLKYRRIGDLAFACMPTGEEIRRPEFREDPVRLTVTVRDAPVLSFMLNPRANLRWVAQPGSEIVVIEGDCLRFEVEPCHTHCSIAIISNIEKRDEWDFTVPGRPERVRPRFFSECFTWVDGEITLSSIAALSPLDTHVLEAA